MKYLFVMFFLTVMKLSADESFDSLQNYSRVAMASIEFELQNYDAAEISIQERIGYLRGKKKVYERILSAKDDYSFDEPYSESSDKPIFFYNGHLYRAILMVHDKDCDCFKYIFTD